MEQYLLTGGVTLLALLLYFWMGLQVAGARRECGIPPPATSGDPLLERTIRAHVNTLEWLPIFLPSLWLFALCWGDQAAAAFGAVWIVGRFVYFRGYVAEVGKRAPGFFIQFCAAAVLLLGALGRIVYLLAIHQGIVVADCDSNQMADLIDEDISQAGRNLSDFIREPAKPEGYLVYVGMAHREAPLYHWHYWIDPKACRIVNVRKDQ